MKLILVLSTFSLIQLKKSVIALLICGISKVNRFMGGIQ